MQKPKSTLSDLYKKGILFKKEFLEFDIDQYEFHQEYKLLIEIVRESTKELQKANEFITSYSKEQLLQGIANTLEKLNTELKYNARWNIKFTDADPSYLETERQGTYFTCAGIQFQAMLDEFYEKAPNQNEIEVDWKNNSKQFEELLFAYRNHVDLKDLIEKHLYFNWEFEKINSTTLRAYPSDSKKEGSPGRDILNNLKSKYFISRLDNMSYKKVATNIFNGQGSTSRETKSEIKYKPVTERDKEWFNIAKYFAHEAKVKHEQEMSLFTNVYFPGIKNLEELELNDGAKLSLRDVFNITSFLSELSRHHINDIDKIYAKAIDHYSKIYTTSKDAQDIAIKSLAFKGDKEKLKKMLSEHCNDDLYRENKKIIEASKNIIFNELCFLKYDYKFIIKTLQWIYQYEEGFIEQVIGIFTFNHNCNDGLTRMPFFIFEKQLCWIPNMIAYAVFSELLLETLIEKKLITIHKIQTDYYERNLKCFFEGYGYKIINNDADKEMKIGKENSKGDFDLLTWKDGHLIFFQLKITTKANRNTYYGRKIWRDKALCKAAEQINVGLDFIGSNPDHIRKILGLTGSEKIEKISSFIVGNSFIFDHEEINGYRKISYSEALDSLAHIEKTKKNDIGNVERYVNFLNENGLFKELEKQPFVANDQPTKIGHYTLITPHLIQQSYYSSLL